MRSLAALILVLLAGVQCDPAGPGCDICTTSAEVFGLVLDPDGQPVANTQVDVRVYREACTDALPAGGTDGGYPRTDAGGHYRARVYSLFGPFVAQCVEIKVPARAAADTAWGIARINTALELRSDYRDPRRRDSVRLDLVLHRKP